MSVYFGRTGCHVDKEECHSHNEPNTKTHDTGVTTQEFLSYRWLTFEFLLEFLIGLPGVALGLVEVVLNSVESVSLLLHYLIESLVHLVDLLQGSRHFDYFLSPLFEVRRVMVYLMVKRLVFHNRLLLLLLVLLKLLTMSRLLLFLLICKTRL